MFDPAEFHGFSYFLGKPPSDKRSTWGVDLDASRAIFQALYSALPLDEPADNPNLPAGYTYLLQLVAHDLVNSTEPLWVAADSNIPVANARAVSLRLDTVYGGGPTVCPLAFTPGLGGIAPDYATKLRLGRVRDAAQQNLSGVCPFRDLARVTMDTIRPTPGATAVSPPVVTALTRKPAANFDDATQIYLADIRNGEGAVLSQVAVLFFILHNAIVDRLAALPAPAQFACARAAVLRCYHAVLRHDLLQRLLHPGIYAQLSIRPASNPDWLWRSAAIPYEFSHGAFRIGHGMPRFHYDLSSLLGQEVAIADLLEGGFLGGALPANWIVQWSKFFDFGGTPNYAFRFAPLQRLALNGNNVVIKVAPDTPLDMSMRDWLSAAAARMWRTDALVAAIEPHYPGMSYLRPAQIARWLTQLLQTQQAPVQAAVQPHLQALSEDLPLPLYVLLESQLDPDAQGQRAGVLASIVIGEVLFRLLAEAEAAAATSPLTDAMRQALGADWAALEAVTTMPDLIHLAETWGNLAQCQKLPFIASPAT